MGSLYVMQDNKDVIISATQYLIWPGEGSSSPPINSAVLETLYNKV